MVDLDRGRLLAGQFLPGGRAVVTPRALVTGDLGFVGRHLAEELIHRGWYVAGFDLQRGPADDLRRRLPATRGGWDLVAHCAAVIGGRAVIEGDPLALAVNLELDAAVMRWAAQRRPGRLLYFSSSAVYPTHLQAAPRAAEPPGWDQLGLPGVPEPDDDLDLDPADLRLTETMARPDDYCGQPDRVYGWAKLAGEALCAELAAQGVPTTVVRPFSGYGSDQGPEYPFGAFCDRALLRADPFVVWGTGEQVRDWVHIDDVIDTCLAAVDQGEPGPLNICTGRATSFAQLAQLFCITAGYQPRLQPMPGQPAGVAYRVGDPTRCQQLHPAPPILLEEGVVRALAERAPVGHR